MWCGEDTESWKLGAAAERLNPEVWKGAPSSWFELIFGVGYAALRTEIDRECGPMYRMYLEMLDE